MSFDSLGLNPDILRAVAEQGYVEPTPIQQQAIPAVLQGRDLMASAQTGTGKTAGFTLPLLQRLIQNEPHAKGRRPVRALILTPTRELAAQVGENVRDYSKYLNIRSLVVFGGVSINPQMMKLRGGVDILVATPGRLLDLEHQNAVSLDKVEILVLDEADRMLDMGFIHDIRRVLAKLPARRQNLLFSATFSDEIKGLAEKLLHNPLEVEVARRNTASEQITQHVHFVDKNRKRELLSQLIGEGNWQQVLVFTRTKHGANHLAEQLNKDGIRSAAIHGNKSQGARTRALADFKSGGIRVLVATDIAARGLDIEELPHVVNYELPNVSAQTGTGKTAGFTLPLLQRLIQNEPHAKGRRPVRALILTPTRELAAQVGENVRDYSKYLNIRSLVVFGGVSINPQMMKLRGGVDILVATPGRLLDLEHQNAVSLDKVEILVLDEADRMLDMGFIHDIRRVLAKLPARRQNLLFSATFSDEIKGLAEKLLHNPLEVEVARRNTASEQITQHVHFVDKNRKRELLSQLIGEGNWQQVLVFTRTKHGANHLAEQLNKDGIRSAAIHGNKSQGARTRALADFKSGGIRVLVATDIAARGLDIEELPHVVNYELPNVPEDYVHRIGRTGRAAATGEALSPPRAVCWTSNIRTPSVLIKLKSSCWTKRTVCWIWALSMTSVAYWPNCRRVDRTCCSRRPSPTRSRAWPRNCCTIRWKWKWRVVTPRPSRSPSTSISLTRTASVNCCRSLSAKATGSRCWCLPVPSMAPTTSRNSSTKTASAARRSMATRARERVPARWPTLNPAAFACWWRPISPPAVWISKSCRTW
ncbi:ATP-dependent RNA helicase RhlE [Klebsiella pneumoniae]|nr:ATP-dependent RNA helicase RhlE [Klebsiella pneumoniae]